MQDKTSRIWQKLSCAEYDQTMMLSQLITDWPRIRDFVSIDGKKMADYFDGINLEDLTPETNEYQEALAKLNEILASLVPKGIDFNNELGIRLAGIFHQGGILFRFQTESRHLISDQQLTMGRTLDKLTKKTDLKTTDFGFTVTETFSFQGDLTPRDDPQADAVYSLSNLPQKINHQGSLLTGTCIQQVFVTGSEITAVIQEISFSSPVKALQELMYSPLSPEEHLGPKVLIYSVPHYKGSLDALREKHFLDPNQPPNTPTQTSESDSNSGNSFDSEWSGQSHSF